jgi:hypothetical protein
VKIVVKKPAMWYNNIVSGCNGLVMLCVDNKVDIDRNFVDFTWVAHSYISLDASHGSGAAEITKKQRFKPRFLVLNPASTLPTYWESDNTILRA